MEMKQNNQYLNSSTEKQIEFEILKKLQNDLQNLILDDNNNNTNTNSNSSNNINDNMSPDDILIMNNCYYSINIINHKNGHEKNIYTDNIYNNNKKNAKFGRNEFAAEVLYLLKISIDSIQ
jgi:hypothetical protein